MRRTDLTPELSSPVIGYRAWRPIGDRLCSIGSIGPASWPVGDYRATCRLPDTAVSHRAPAPDCSCGIYARHSRHPIAPVTPDRLPGLMIAWGSIEVHHDGLRAEWARPVLLISDETCGRETRRALHAVAKLYGLDVVPRERVRDAAAQYGDPVPRRLLPVDPATTMLRALRGSLSGADTAPALAQRYGGDRALIAEALVTANADLVLAEARRHVMPGVSLMAYLQAGALGLVHAAERSRSDYARFRVEAAWWIRQAICVARQHGLLTSFNPRTTTYGALEHELSGREPRRRDLDLIERAVGAEQIRVRVPPRSPDEYGMVLRELELAGRTDVLSWWMLRLGERVVD